MSPALTFLLIMVGIGLLLLALFIAGAMRQSSYLSRQEEARDDRYRTGGWPATTDNPGEDR